MTTTQTDMIFRPWDGSWQTLDVNDKLSNGNKPNSNSEPTKTKSKSPILPAISQRNSNSTKKDKPSKEIRKVKCRTCKKSHKSCICSPKTLNEDSTAAHLQRQGISVQATDGNCLQDALHCQSVKIDEFKQLTYPLVNIHQHMNTEATDTKQKRKKNKLCNTCKGTFISKGQLEAHKRSHSGQRPFVCDYINSKTNKKCESKFIRNEELTRHKRIHTGEKPHKCPCCEKKFGRRDHLQKHMKKHKGTEQVSMQRLIETQSITGQLNPPCLEPNIIQGPPALPSLVALNPLNLGRGYPDQLNLHGGYADPRNITRGYAEPINYIIRGYTEPLNLGGGYPGAKRSSSLPHPQGLHLGIYGSTMVQIPPQSFTMSRLDMRQYGPGYLS